MTWVLGQSTGGGDIPVPNWIGELAFGAVVILALLGYVWFKPAVKTLLERIEKAEAQRDALIEVYQDEVIPALRDANVGVVEVVGVVKDAVPALDQARRAIERAMAALDDRGR